MYIKNYKHCVLFEVHYELEPTLPTPDDHPANTSLELSMAPSSSTTVAVSGVSIQGDGISLISLEDQPWVLEQTAELSKCKEFAQITCGCTKAKRKAM